MTNPSALQITALVLFLLALVHVFLAPKIEGLAHRRRKHASIFHLLGEVEVVFGFWALVLFFADVLLRGSETAIQQLEVLNFREPLFVFVIMVVAGCGPVLAGASSLVERLARLIPMPGAMPFALVTLTLAPLLGSLITEPAAMTVAALLLRKRVFSDGTSEKMRYGAIGVLFVNVSIGGVLTSYAAPPVLMVAGAWGWNTSYMLSHFGLRAGLAVLLNAAVFTGVFRRELSQMQTPRVSRIERMPIALIVAHVAFVSAIVAASHHTVLFVGLFLFFLGMVQIYKHHHTALLLREGLLVGFFLAGLVVLGNPQSWWLQPLVSSLGDTALFLGTTALTAIVDNAALTYLGSLIPTTTESFRYHLVAGAVVGGGLTLIANAPNPAGASILKERFQDGAIGPGKLFLAALAPTLVALVAFGI